MTKSEYKIDFNKSFNNALKIACVFNFNEEDGGKEKAVESLERLTTCKDSPLLESPTTRYAAILHLETDIPHIHLCAWFNVGRSKKNYIKAFVDFLGVKKAEAVQVQSMLFDRGAVRYLCHLDDVDTKVVHDPSEIVTNCPADLAEHFIDNPLTKGVDIEELAACQSVRDVLKILPDPSFYTSYRTLWHDLMEEDRKQMLVDKKMRELQYVKGKLYDLYFDLESMARSVEEIEGGCKAYMARLYATGENEKYTQLTMAFDNLSKKIKMEMQSIKKYQNEGVIEE